MPKISIVENYGFVDFGHLRETEIANNKNEQRALFKGLESVLSGYISNLKNNSGAGIKDDDFTFEIVENDNEFLELKMNLVYDFNNSDTSYTELMDVLNRLSVCYIGAYVDGYVRAKRNGEG